MLGESRAPIDHVCLPQNRREVLRCASDGSHSERLPIFVSGIVEIVLALSEINQFKLAFLCEEQIRRLDIPMANSFALQKRTRRDERAIHLNQLLLSEMLFLFLPLPVQVFQVHISIHVLRDNSEFVGIVFSLAEIISIRTNDIGMTLYFH